MLTLDAQSRNHLIITEKKKKNYTLKNPIMLLMLLYINFVVSLSPLGYYVHPSDVPLGPKIDIAGFPQ